MCVVCTCQCYMCGAFVMYVRYSCQLYMCFCGLYVVCVVYKYVCCILIVYVQYMISVSGVSCIEF